MRIKASKIKNMKSASQQDQWTRSERYTLFFPVIINIEGWLTLRISRC